jgi:hypothetical protein
MRRITWMLMLLAVVAIPAAPAFAQHGRGRGHVGHHAHGQRHYAPRHYGYRGYVPNYRRLWLNSSPSYYHAPYTRMYRPGCYGGHVGYRGSSFGFHIRF